MPAGYTTIQAAINASKSGDTILVAEGTYYENIKFSGKAVTLASLFILDGDENHILNTVIDGSQSKNSYQSFTINILSREDTTTILCGFTIQGGKGRYLSENEEYIGGGICIDHAGAKIINNHIKGNIINTQIDVVVAGGGIFIRPEISESQSRSVIIRDNIISGNELYGKGALLGGGISIVGKGNVSIINNTISKNIVKGEFMIKGGGIAIISEGEIKISTNEIVNNECHAIKPHDWMSGGGGIFLSNNGGNVQEWEKLIIVKNIIADNYAPYGGGINGIGWEEGFNFDLVNNTIIQNTAEYKGGGVFIHNGVCKSVNNIFWKNAAKVDEDIFYRGDLEIEYCLTQREFIGSGNIHTDPCFENDAFELSNSSPAVDAGNPADSFRDTFDPDNPTLPLPPAKGTLTADMGSYGGNDIIDIPIRRYSIHNNFLYGKFDDMAYRLALPLNYNENSSYPLSVVLHGSRQWGKDNERQLLEGLAWRVNSEYYNYDEFTLVPQSPTQSGWNLESNLTKVFTIIESLIRKFSIDTTRILVTGWSLGGIGTKSMISMRPDFFSAGIPVSSPATIFNNLKHIPFWVYHGDADAVVGSGISRQFIEKFASTGVNAILAEESTENELNDAIKENARLFYSEIKSADHFILYYAYDNPFMFEWLKNQSVPLIRPVNYKLDYLNKDSLLFQTGFKNPGGFSFENTLVIENPKLETIFERVLYDDGEHGDEMAEDGIWGTYINIPPDQLKLRFGIEITNLDNGKSYYFNDLINFEIPVTEEKKFLYQNYPNPFINCTNIGYIISEASHVDLLIYNSFGQKITELVSKNHDPGEYYKEWDALYFKPGIYFYTLRTHKCTQTKKMILLPSGK